MNTHLALARDEEQKRGHRPRRRPLSAQSSNHPASLPDKQRRRYLALKVAGYSYREICTLTGASYTNVNRHLTRARARVREARAA